MTTAVIDDAQRAHEWDSLLARLDKAGVPRDVRWRTLILYMRNVKSFYFLTEDQKSRLQELILETVRGKDFSDERFEDIVRRHEEVLLGPYREKLEVTMSESEAMLKDFRDLVRRRKGDVQNLEVLTVDLVDSELTPKEMLSAMRKAFHEVVNSMEQDMDDLTRMSMTDALTQLYNRRAFDQRLEQAVVQARAENAPLSLVMIDIDHFKRFNDTYGHRIGDQALQVVSKVLRLLGQERNADGEEHYWAARYGGEEFSVILPGCGTEEAVRQAECIRRRVERYNFTIQDNDGNVLHDGIKITVSLGVAKLSNEWRGALSGNLVEAADRNLYRAKENGRNRVVG